MKTEIKMCTVVQGKNLETFVKNLKKAQASADMVELRTDSIHNFNVDDLPIIKGLVKVPSIFTFRHENEGGLFKGDIAQQKEIIEKAFEYDFTYVDVSYYNPLASNLKIKKRKKLLLSYHNNEGTPEVDDLLNLLDKMRSFHPAIIKIATLVNDWDDVPILSSLLKNRKKEEKLIVIGMGDKGQLTRLFFPVMGSYIAFVTMKGDKNIAPGMLTKENFKPIIKYINKKNHAG